MVEDSALEFHAMNRLPGPYMCGVHFMSVLRHHTNCSILAISKYFLEELGNDGLNKLLFPYDDKSADAVCTFAFSLGPTSEPLIFQGRLPVRIENVGDLNLNTTLTLVKGQDCSCERTARVRYVSLDQSRSPGRKELTYSQDGNRFSSIKEKLSRRWPMIRR